MGLVMRDRVRGMRDRGEGPGPLRCQTQKSVHFPGDPLILVVNNLTPGPHVKIPDIEDGQLPVDNILVYGEFRKKGNSQVLSQQLMINSVLPISRKGCISLPWAARYWSRMKR